MTDEKPQENADVIDINGNEGKQYVSFKIAEETYICLLYTSPSPRDV